MFTFLRSLLIVHDWDRPAGADVRRCRICGRREELDVYDGGSVNAWYVIWKGYPRAHFAGKRRKPAAQAMNSAFAAQRQNERENDGASAIR